MKSFLKWAGDSFMLVNRIKSTLSKCGGLKEMTLDMKMEACWMLVRALENAQRLGLKSSRYHDFDNWFHENIVGV